MTLDGLDSPHQDKENERKKNQAFEKDLEKVNRELCPTCPRGGNEGAPKCPVEVYRRRSVGRSTPGCRALLFRQMVDQSEVGGC